MQEPARSARQALAKKPAVDGRSALRFIPFQYYVPTTIAIVTDEKAAHAGRRKGLAQALDSRG
jgi:hypothetical protein